MPLTKINEIVAAPKLFDQPAHNKLLGALDPINAVG